MDTQSVNTFTFSGVVMEEPEPLINEKTKEVIGHSVALGQTGFRIRFYIPAKVLNGITEGDSLLIQGQMKEAPTGWAKATTASKAKKLNGAEAAKQAANAA
ncbi:MAG: hypothetical protein AAGB26_07505 [Planctomycetota bacterium]